jgi:hypothetical protein
MDEVPDVDPEEAAGRIADVLRDIVEDAESTYRSPSVLYQDFLVRCRMVGLARPPLDLSGFVRRLSAARAGIHGDPDADWAQALDAARALPDDMLGPFLLVARAAREGLPCPSDTELAATYGTSSAGCGGCSLISRARNCSSRASTSPASDRSPSRGWGGPRSRPRLARRRARGAATPRWRRHG